MSLLNLMVLAALVGSFWYRVSRAGSETDFRRIRAMFQYVATAVLIIPAGYIVLGLYSVPPDLEALAVNILLMLLLAAVLPIFNVRVVALAGTLIVLLDPNNQLSTSLFILPAFVIPVLAGSILGAGLFRRFFERRMQGATREEHHPAANT